MLKSHRRNHLRIWLVLAIALPLLLLVALNIDRGLPPEAAHPGLDPRTPLGSSLGTSIEPIGEKPGEKQ